MAALEGEVAGWSGRRQAQRQVTEKEAQRNGPRKWARDRQTRDRDSERCPERQQEGRDTQTQREKLGQRQRGGVERQGYVETEEKWGRDNVTERGRNTETKLESGVV